MGINYDSMWLHFEIFKIKNDIENFRLYIYTLQSTIDDNKKKLQSSLDSSAKEYDDNDFGYTVYDHYEDEIDQTFRFIPSTFHTSAFLIIFQHFEIQLKKYSNHAIKKGIGKPKKHININNRKENYLIKYRTPLGAIVDFKAVKSEWNMMLDFQQIRNKICHSENSSSNTVRNIVDRYSGLSITNERFDFTEELLIEFNDACGKILLLIGNSLYVLSKKK